MLSLMTITSMGPAVRQTSSERSVESQILCCLCRKIMSSLVANMNQSIIIRGQRKCHKLRIGRKVGLARWLSTMPHIARCVQGNIHVKQMQSANKQIKNSKGPLRMHAHERKPCRGPRPCKLKANQRASGVLQAGHWLGKFTICEYKRRTLIEAKLAV